MNLDTISRARQIYCRMRTDEMMREPRQITKAVKWAMSENSDAAGVVMMNILNSGDISSLLDFDELVRNSLWEMALNEYHGGEAA